MNKTDILMYTGGATSRTVTKEEWQEAGVKGQDTVSWHPANRKRVQCGDLSEDAFLLLVELHGNEFQVIKPDQAKQIDALREASESGNPNASIPPAPNGN